MDDRKLSHAGESSAGSSLQGAHRQTAGEEKAAGGRSSIPSLCNATVLKDAQTHVLEEAPSDVVTRLELHLLKLEEVGPLLLQQAQLAMEDAGVDAFLERGAWCQLETDLLQRKICVLAASIDAQLKSGDDEA
ncbi:hypothetical protein Esti_006417 [Eimeria stiedai]